VQQVVEVFKSRCDARFHWGKAGWSTFWPCFDGAVTYPDTWCHFGCAVEVTSAHHLLIGLPLTTSISMPSSFRLDTC